jgi:hypothetical protein
MPPLRHVIPQRSEQRTERMDLLSASMTVNSFSRRRTLDGAQPA